MGPIVSSSTPVVVFSPILLFVVACGSATLPESPPPVPEVVTPSADERALGKADALAQEAGSTLKTRMVQELGAGGPGEAMEACSMEADALTASAVPAGSGARVGRSSLRLRSAENRAPVWVQDWLDAQGERPFAGAEGIRRVDVSETGRVARVLTPIPVQPPCLVCHGSEEQIPVDVRTSLAQRYPDDQARNYAPGDLRGALWAEVPVTDGG